MTTPLDWILIILVFSAVVAIGYKILRQQWSDEERLGEDGSGEQDRE